MGTFAVKKLSIILSILICFPGLGSAQTYKEAIRQDSARVAGSFYVYDAGALPAMTPAPEGYEPFYISQFARHGARWCTSEYEALYNWFKKASEAGELTDAGKEFLARYEPFFRKAWLCKGNLTKLGQKQHRGIAERMFERFPEVFDGPTHVEASSTEVTRVIMSMWSCLSGLQARDKDIDISADASVKFASWLQPSQQMNPYLIKGSFSCGDACKTAVSNYFEESVPWKELACRFFTDEDVIKNTLKTTPVHFFDYLHSLIVDTKYCLDTDRDYFDGLFSSEELYHIWKGVSARYFVDVAYLEGSKSLILDYAAFTLGQIIETADADMASGSTQLRLRFGHDSGIAPLLVLLDADGCGRSTSSFEECLEIFPSYKIPMGASAQFVFFRNASGNILFKLLVNEQEATLPLAPVQGPYYSWNDFKEHYLPIIRASKRKIINHEPLAILKSTDWGWQPVSGSKVEQGHASVKVFGSVQDISLIRFRTQDHSVSIVESDGPKAAITSKFGKDNKALAAINGSYFDGNVMPVTFVKDEGKVLCSLTSDGVNRCNGMFRIQDRKGKKIDIISVDSLTTAKAAKGWREAIVSGPVLLEDGLPIIYENDGSRSYRRFYAKRHPRTILGYTSDGWLYFIVVDGRFPGQGEGMSINELQLLCESLGMYEALNLDGGGSSTLWSAGTGVVNHPYDNKRFDHEGERVVPNVIIVK